MVHEHAWGWGGLKDRSPNQLLFFTNLCFPSSTNINKKLTFHVVNIWNYGFLGLAIYRLNNAKALVTITCHLYFAHALCFTASIDSPGKMGALTIFT